MTAMEQRRLGSVTKPAVLVPNQMLERRIHGFESKLDDARAELDAVGHEADQARRRLGLDFTTRRDSTSCVDAKPR